MNNCARRAPTRVTLFGGKENGGLVERNGGMVEWRNTLNILKYGIHGIRGMRGKYLKKVPPKSVPPSRHSTK